ncbi:hypothetical protein [Sporolactobacillus pectinivorans]|uniref:hypothetical protein n=1 Tax=Sporolactobacillus pectinivorans TaxID=1591408 RepID=UPI000C26B50F|nr:hypothetical protein [Sporolactobacillus pectinivorans]
MHDYDEVIHYFNDNISERNDEVSLYALLKPLREYELKDHWSREFNSALKKGVKLREALRRMYRYLQENGALPDYMFPF